METIIKKAIFTLFITVSAFAATAQDSTVNAEEPAYVNFLKVEEGQLFFTVKYANTDGKKFNVFVYGQDGENLYRGYFSGKNFGRIFRAPVELGTLQVLVKDNKGKTEHKFEISSEARTIREAYVTAVSNRH